MHYYKNKPFEVGTLVFTNIDDAKTEAAKRSKSREHGFASSITQELQPGIYGYQGSSFVVAQFRNGRNITPKCTPEFLAQFPQMQAFW